MNKHKFNYLKKTTHKNYSLTLQTLSIYKIKSNLQNFPLREKVDQPNKRKRVLCWSIYIISLCLTLKQPTKQPLGCSEWPSEGVNPPPLMMAQSRSFRLASWVGGGGGGPPGTGSGKGGIGK